MYTLRLLLKLNYTSSSIHKPTAELLHGINPLAAGMTGCERGRCRTKSRLAGWTHILGMDAQNMSQRMADHRRRVASEMGSRSLLTPPTPFSLLVMLLFFPCSFSLGISCSCLCTVCICLSIWYLYKHCLVSLPPPLHTAFSDPLIAKLTVRKATSGFLKGSTYASKIPTESSSIMTEAFPLTWRWLPHHLSPHSPPPAGHTKSLKMSKKKKNLKDILPCWWTRWLRSDNTED